MSLAAQCQPHDHVVQFYADATTLPEAVADFLESGARIGERLVVLLTPIHRSALLEQLEARGLNTQAAMASGELVAKDARSLLSAIMRDDMPDKVLFERHLLADIEAGSPRPTRAFGELVNLLCADGNAEAAVRLEALWHAACQRLPLTLLCSYDLQHFRRPGDKNAFQAICDHHSRVLPGEGFCQLVPDQQLREVSRLQQQAQVLRHEVATREQAERNLVAVQQLCDEKLQAFADQAFHDALMRHANLARGLDPYRGLRPDRLAIHALGDPGPDHLARQRALREAPKRGEFALHYCPLLCAQSGQIVALSAQPRWHSPDFGMLAPSCWMPIAEENDQLAELCRWVLLDICRHARDWVEAGANMRVAALLTSEDLLNGDLVDGVNETLTRSGLPAEWFELELPESTLMRDPRRTQEVLERLKALGVGVVVDAFGSRHSMLDHISRFPIDTLKLDEHFIHGCLDNARHQAIVRSVIALAHERGIRVTANGVATRAQADYLGRQGCDYLQGSLWSRMEYSEHIAMT
ncbi:EAL domain-containing protein [Halomonas korlensis]|uniref:EAL domain, c-di-GMP-specific phosphodiesterase class I (Or its enzymatically inactive variant) n=1 Tax=Halomonas korlensis TaxID=463301 RepID=A0A1I7KDA6_9GAMM|nr:EAL domain-containing protein [Halomonas korlensis]SFU95346.1 EAL domain, c-di-GMP-specific phosphodiesterase class I (or its enzymatically inactive variant) [Halomonas korlensis]